MFQIFNEERQVIKLYLIGRDAKFPRSWYVKNEFSYWIFENLTNLNINDSLKIQNIENNNIEEVSIAENIIYLGKWAWQVNEEVPTYFIEYYFTVLVEKWDWKKMIEIEMQLSI